MQLVINHWHARFSLENTHDSCQSPEQSVYALFTVLAQYTV
jgi:hypothetical protein